MKWSINGTKCFSPVSSGAHMAMRDTRGFYFFFYYYYYLLFTFSLKSFDFFLFLRVRKNLVPLFWPQEVIHHLYYLYCSPDMVSKNIKAHWISKQETFWNCIGYGVAEAKSFLYFNWGFPCCPEHDAETESISLLPQPNAYITCVTRKQTLRSLSLSYPKKDGRAWPRPSFFWYDTDFSEFESFDVIDQIL